MLTRPSYTTPSLWQIIGPWSFCLFLSGFGILGAELLWTRYLALAAGATALVQVSVLVFFMGGLAAGQCIGGRWADRAQTPFQSYAGLQLLVGVYFLVYPFIYRGIERSVNSSSLAILLMLHGLTIFIPSLLSGASWPMVTKPFLADATPSDRIVGGLYGANNLGAVAGILITAYFGLALLGLTGMMVGLGLMHIAAALLAWFFARSNAENLPDISSIKRSLPDNQKRDSMAIRPRTLLLVTAVFAFCAMSYEVGFVRAFGLLLGSSTYAFAATVGAFILGIAAGSLFISRSNYPASEVLHKLGRSQLVLALAMGAAPLLLQALPWIYLWLMQDVARPEMTFGLYQLLGFCLSFVAVLPASFLSGMALPLATRLLPDLRQQTGRQIGGLFGANAIGSLLGIIAPGLFLFPVFGLGGLFLISALVHLVAAIAIMPRHQRLIGTLTWPALLIFGAAGWSVWSGAYREALIQGPFRLRGDASAHRTLSLLVQEQQILFDRDGQHATVSVIANPSGERILYIEGKPDASLRGDFPTQCLLADLPLLLIKTVPRKVLVIGFGSGTTSGAALQHPVDEVHSVEISPEVFAASAFFNEVNGNALQNPRHRRYLTDAKVFLKRTDVTFDVIISEPSNPWMSGVAALFTVEHFQAARAHLTPGGVMAQWFHLYQMSDQTFRDIVASFQQVFPHVRIFNPLGNDIIMLGSTEEIRPAWKDLEGRFQRIQERSAAYGLSHVSTLLRLELAATPALEELLQGGRIYHDHHPRLEFEAARAGNATVFSRELWRWGFFKSESRQTSLLYPAYERARRTPISAIEWRATGEYLKRWWDAPGEAVFNEYQKTRRF